MPAKPRTYRLTPEIIAARVGAGVMCLSAVGEGRTYRLYPERPGAELNVRMRSAARVEADPYARPAPVSAPSEPASALVRVDISGPIEQRAQWVECEGYVDGHDAIAERLCAAFAEGDVLLVGDGPGGAAAGLQQNVARALAAKAEHGRRCTGVVDEQMGSALTWWMMAVCDEIFGASPAAQFGSVGARGGHMSIAGMLEKEGLVMTYFADPPEKVALAPELPLSVEGARRGNRDVSIAADAFRAAVCESQIGKRFGLTPEGLVALGADMLTGDAAVGVFADGVDTIEAITAYALALAESPAARETESEARATTKITGAAGATKGGPMGLRAEEKEPDGDEKPEGEKTEEEKGSTIPTKCASCGVENPKGGHFCMGCGESMSTEPEEKPEPEKKEEKAARVSAPAKMSADASLASILGATGESPLALKTAAIGLRQIKDTAVGITGQTAPGAIVGALLTMPERLAQADLAAQTERARAATAERTTRRDLASRLNKLSLDGWPRTAIYSDRIDDATGKPVSPPPLSKSIAAWDLSEFRGYVEGFEKKARPATPFVAPRESAQAGAREHGEREAAVVGGAPQLGADGEPTAAQIAIARKDPTVIKMLGTMMTNGNVPALPEGKSLLDVLAAQHVKTCASMGVGIGGGQ